MLNEVILVGRLTKKPEVMKNQDGSKFTIINLAVPRSNKNADGEYETDFINCVASKNIANTICEYCEKGDLVGVRGEIQNVDYTAQLQIVVEMITFLSSRQKD